MKNNFTAQRGFSLIEISIVLVIIGLLLGGVLKGTELIENSKVRKAVAEFNGTTAAFYAYQDRYGKLPGDDGVLTTLRSRGNSWANITQAGDRNGVVRARSNTTFTGGDENDNFWQHLRAAGFITGNPADAGINALPRNAFGGVMGLSSEDMGGGLTGLKLCMSQVPGKAAVSIDSQLDDGLSNSGKVRASDATSGQNTAPSNTASAVYNEDNMYTVCTTM